MYELTDRGRALLAAVSGRRGARLMAVATITRDRYRDRWPAA